jgi:hypothetical protein
MASIRSKVYEWNSKYPIDFIWRRKYKVPFGSKKLKSMDFLSMLFDLLEEHEINRITVINIEERQNKTSNVDQFDNNKMSSKEVDDAFDNVDLEDYNK